MPMSSWPWDICKLYQSQENTPIILTSNGKYSSLVALYVVLELAMALYCEMNQLHLKE